MFKITEKPAAPTTRKPSSIKGFEGLKKIMGPSRGERAIRGLRTPKMVRF